VNTFKKTEPWFFTEEIMRKHLQDAAPYLNGKLLDAGCGARRYQDILSCDAYVGLDADARFNPDYVADLRRLPFKDSEFDSILSTQVLEHIDDTDRVLREFHRVLKPGGYLCITVPFIGRLHGEPCDYWRFSRYGIKCLFSRHGFEEILIEGMGGFATAQSYLWAFWLWETLQDSTWRRALRSAIIYFINHIAMLVYRFDRDKSTPFNYIGVGRKHSPSMG